jgi:hypothetical protein
MLPLATFPMHYYPATDTMESCRLSNPNLPLESKQSRLSNPAVRGGMTISFGARQ